MEHSIVREVVTLDENGEGHVKYPPIKKFSTVTDKPACIRWTDGRLAGEPGMEVTISYISLYEGEIGE